MITGTVNADLEATIKIAVRGVAGSEREFLAVVDTGFNGALTLPIGSISELELPWRSQGTVTLADGSEVETDVYVARVIWNGLERVVLLEAADTEPLVGMAMLEFHRVRMELVDSGNVLIEPLRA